MTHDITINDWVQHREKFTLVDVRSPIEFMESAIPTAVNIPIFNNKERAIVGTLYKQRGKAAAKWRAMEIVSPKIPSLMREIHSLGQNGTIPLIYCWRGGMRSKSIAQFATLAGLNVARLVGGYRAFRQKALQMIPQLLPPKVVVFHGMTGTGKTDILLSLKEKGYPVIDLEALANHRGSLFGAIDGRVPHNQKTFDGLLFLQLLALQHSPYIIIEGESKRIGHAVQPEELLHHQKTALHLFVSATLSQRKQRIYKEYVEPHLSDKNFHSRVTEAFRYVKKRLKPESVKYEIEQALYEKNYDKFIEKLMIYYYDPRYLYKEEKFMQKAPTINSNDIHSAVNEAESILNNKGFYPRSTYQNKNYT